MARWCQFGVIGIGQILAGICCLVTIGIEVWKYYYFREGVTLIVHNVPYWAGIMFVVTGFISVEVWRSQTKASVSLSVFMYLISAIFADAVLLCQRSNAMKDIIKTISYDTMYVISGSVFAILTLWGLLLASVTICCSPGAFQRQEYTRMKSKEYAPLV